MRALPLIITGVLSASVFTAACGSVDQTQQSTGASVGVGGGGGAGPVATSQAATTGEASSTAASTASSTSATTGTGGAPDIGQPSDIYPAKHQSPPKVITYGGPVLTAPRVHPVFFAGDNAGLVASTIDFYNKIGPTAYWAATVSEYGVGALSAGAPIKLTELAPTSTTDAAIQTWLAAKLNANDPAFPTPDANTIIALNYPAGVSIDLQGSKSCQTFLGYHSNLTLDAAHGNMDVAYIVIPRCSMQSTGMGLLDSITDTGSHELIEASTDPYPQTNGAYGQVDNNHLYWLLALGGGETGDMCAQSATASYKDPEVGYLVQRSWSNVAVIAGHDPCVPAASKVYFNSAPLMLDLVTLGIGGQSLKLKGVKIPVGSTKTVEVDLFSDAPVSGPWTVKAYDYSQIMGGPQTLDFAFDADSGLNGQKLHLDITALEQGQYNVEIFYIVSELGTQQNVWIGVVGE
jgi:hypothetical protein